jgi:hypothetical protein
MFSCWRRVLSRASNAKLLEAYSHYLIMPSEAFAEASARVLLPPSYEIDRHSFETIFENTFALVKARLIKEGIASKPSKYWNFNNDQ